MIVREDCYLCGNTFKKVFKNSTRAPLATGSRLQAAVERTSSDGAAAAKHGGGGGGVGWGGVSVQL